jgi:hypothetical protein
LVCLLLCAPLLIDSPALDRLALGCALFFRRLPALVGTLLFIGRASACLFGRPTLLLRADAFLCLLLCASPLLSRPCLFRLPLLGGPGGLVLRLTPLLCGALLSLALLGDSCCLLLCLTLLLRRTLLVCRPASLSFVRTCSRCGR